jgi:hypothetical protein
MLQDFLLGHRVIEGEKHIADIKNDGVEFHKVGQSGKTGSERIQVLIPITGRNGTTAAQEFWRVARRKTDGYLL